MERKRIIKIGVVVTLSIFLLVWGVNYLNNKNLFKPENVYYGVYKNINGLTTSGAVLLNGYKIGQVSDIYFQDGKSNKLIVEFLIDSKFKLPENSIAQIFSMDIMGTKGINILRNDSIKTSKYLESGDTLKSATEEGLKEQVSMQILPFKAKAEELLSSMDSVLTVIKTIFDNNTRKNISSSFASISVTLRNLESTTYTLDTLMKQEKTALASILNNTASITNNIKNNNEKIDNIINNFSIMSDSLAKSNFTDIINNANKTIANLDLILTKVNEGEGSLGMLLKNDTLYTNLENASYNLSALLRDLKENPKRYVRFSAFDLGRTVIVTDDKKAKKEKKIKKPE